MCGLASALRFTSCVQPVERLGCDLGRDPGRPDGAGDPLLSSVRRPIQPSSCLIYMRQSLCAMADADGAAIDVTWHVWVYVMCMSEYV